MNIAILTQPLHTNYGGLLQNYALQSVLKRLGHEVKTINIGTKDTYSIYIYECFKVLIKKMLGRKEFYPLPPNHKLRIRENTNTFINKNINTTNPLKWINKNFQDKYKFDAYIVGSDQVWRPAYNFRIQDMYFEFLQEHTVKRVAYAASFGTDLWEYTQKQTLICAELAQKFDAISVREASGVELCKDHLNVVATHVLDPTFLLQREDYESLLNSIEVNKNKDQLTVYILDLDENKKRFIDQVTVSLGLSICFIGNPHFENQRINYNKRVAPPVESWIQGFVEAKYVITDSFHGTIFSIIFNKPFITIGNTMRGLTRFKSLLNIFNLEDRLVHSLNELSPAILESKINWMEVNRTLSTEKEKSLEFLIKNL